MGNLIILFGIILVVVGIIFNILSKFGIPFLPGDILIKKDHFTFYFPIVASILISIILTIIFNLINKK